MNGDIKNSLESMDRRLMLTNTHINTCTGYMLKLNETVSEIKNSVFEFKSNISELKNSISELKSSISELKSDVTELKTMVMLTGQKLDTLSNDIKEIKELLKKD